MIATTDADFRFLQQFLYERSAIVLGEDKHYLLDSRLPPVLRRVGSESVSDLVRALRRGDPSLETAVVDALTTNETSWFRDGAPFEALRRHVLPELVAENSLRRCLSIWSAAASTGQELYSIAMLLDAEFPEVASWRLDLHGTDLSTEVIERARTGRFSALEINRGLPAAFLVRYFRREGAHYVIADSLRSRVRFEQLNLVKPWPPRQDYDLILLRNVLIYFDEPARRRVLAAVRDHLRPNGYLVLGTAETPRGLVGGLVAVSAAGATFFRLEQAGDAASGRPAFAQAGAERAMPAGSGAGEASGKEEG